MRTLNVVIIFSFLGAYTAFAQCLTDFRKLIPDPGPDYSSGFGRSLSMYGEFLAVGSPAADSVKASNGVVYMYQKFSNGWRKVASIAPAVFRDSLGFGVQVKLSRNYLLVSSDAKNGGKVHVFRKTSADWSTYVEETIFSVTGTSNFGVHAWSNAMLTISPDESVIAVTDPSVLHSESRYGSVFLFRRTTGGTWSTAPPPVVLKAPVDSTYSFGIGGVAFYESRIAIATPYAFGSKGAIYIYRDDDKIFDTPALERILRSAPGDSTTSYMASSSLVFNRDGIFTDALKGSFMDAEPVMIHFAADPTGTFFSDVSTCDDNLEGLGAIWDFPVLVQGENNLYAVVRKTAINIVVAKLTPGASGWCASTVTMIGSVTNTNFSFNPMIVGNSSGDFAVSGLKNEFEQQGFLVGSVSNETLVRTQRIFTTSVNARGHEFGTDVVVRDSVMFVGSPSDAGLRPGAGSVYIYAQKRKEWLPIGKMNAPFSNVTSFGAGIAATDSLLAVVGYDVEPGSVYVYRKLSDWSSPEFVQQIKLPDSLGALYISSSIAMDGEWLAIPYSIGFVSRVAIFRYVDGQFNFHQRAGVEQGFIFTKGITLDIDIQGETMAYGGWIMSLGSDDQWRLSAVLSVTDPQPFQLTFVWGVGPVIVNNGSFFGGSVDIEGDVIAVGAPGWDNAAGEWEVGAVYLFTKAPGTNWRNQTETNKILPRVQTDGELFGVSVDIRDNLLLVSARGNSVYRSGYPREKPGRAYVFQSKDYGWTDVIRLIDVTGDTFKYDEFGASVAIATDHFIVSARLEDSSNGSVSGTVYVIDAPPRVKLVPPICGLRDSITLFGYPFEGVWSGPGIVDEVRGVFDPRLAGYGKHELSYRTASCSFLGKMILEVRPPIDIHAISDTLIYVCKDKPVSTTISVLEIAGVEYKWFFKDLGENIYFPFEVGGASVVATRRGDYYARVNETYCAGNSAVIKVRDEEVTVDSNLPARMICNEVPASVQLDASPPGGVWTGTGVYGSEFISKNVPAGKQTLKYTFTSSIGCIYEAVEEVDIRKVAPPAIRQSSDLCSEGFVDLTVSEPMPTVTYDWYRLLSGEDSLFVAGNSNSFRTSERGRYMIIARDESCSSAGSRVSISGSFKAHLTPERTDITLCNGENALLGIVSDKSAPFNAEWFVLRSNSDEPVSLSESSSTLEVTETGRYFARVESGVCMIETDTADVVIKDPNEINVPNVITPNDDGKNDFFQVTGNVDDVRIFIFSRNGKEVYKGIGTDVWRAAQHSAGVYYWLVTYKTCEGELKKLNGWVHVIK